MPKRAKHRAAGRLLRVPLVLVVAWAEPAVARSLGLALNPPAGFDFHNQLLAAAAGWFLSSCEPPGPCPKGGLSALPIPS